MSQKVNANFAKCFIVFMGLVILVQGVLYLGLAIWGVTVYNCGGDNSNPMNRTFEFVLDLIYFSNEKCGPPILHFEEHGIEEDIPLEIDYATASVVSNREFIFLITYIVISALWVITSLMVLCTVCGAITKFVVGFCFWPWLLIVLVGSILDAVATGFHVYDITQTVSATSTFEYVGVKNEDIILKYLQEYDIYFIAPAVTFTCISSRIVLIWLLNIIGCCFCLSLVRVLLFNNLKRSKEDNGTTIHSHISENESQMQEIEQEAIVVLRPQTATAPPTEVFHREPPSVESTQIIRNQNGNSQSPTKNVQQYEYKTEIIIPPDTATYRSSEAHPEKLDYPNNRQSGALPTTPLRSPTPELSTISPLNMRYSTSEMYPFHHQGHISQELRGQLPWSYTNVFSDPVAQKRIQAHLPEQSDSLPSTPAADYTFNPSKKDRLSVNKSQTGYSRW